MTTPDPRDLVERLRDMKAVGVRPMRLEAADEIERLRKAGEEQNTLLAGQLAVTASELVKDFEGRAGTLMVATHAFLLQVAALLRALSAQPVGVGDGDRLDIQQLVANLREAAEKHSDGAKVCNNAADAMQVYYDWLYAKVHRALTAPAPQRKEG